LGVEWVWGLLQPGFVRWTPHPASQDHFNHCDHGVQLRPQVPPIFCMTPRSTIFCMMWKLSYKLTFSSRHGRHHVSALTLSVGWQASGLQKMLLNNNLGRFSLGGRPLAKLALTCNRGICVFVSDVEWGYSHIFFRCQVSSGFCIRKIIKIGWFFKIKIKVGAFFDTR